MNFLLKLLGLEPGADVHRLAGGTWSAAHELPWQLLSLVCLVGLALAALNFLPWISMRLGVRLSTFALRLGMLLVLIAVLVGLEWHVRLELNEPQQWTVLVDDSASMAAADVDGHTRYQAALADLDKIRKSIGTRARLSVATFSGAPLGEAESKQAEPGTGPTMFADVLARAALSRAKVDRLVLLTDGRDSEGRDLARLGEDVKSRDIQLSVALYGSTSVPTDRGIAAEPERSVIRLGDEMIIRGSVQGGPKQAESMVTLKEDGKDIRTFPVVAAANGRFEVRYRPKRKGVHTCTLELPAGDVVAQNNSVSFNVNVIEEKINVLLIEGFPRFEFKLVKGVLEVDPLVNLVSVSHMPGGGVYVQGAPLHRNPEQGLISSQAELFKYDIVVLRDVPRSYFRADGDTSESRLRLLADFVTKRGGGLVVMGGQDVYRAGGYQDSHLVDVLPFDLGDQISGDDQFDGLFYASIPKPAFDHPILQLLPDAAENRERLTSLPQLDGSNNVGRFKPLAVPLLTRTVKVKGKGSEPVEKDAPILGYIAVGDGKVVAAAVDTLWQWQLQSEFDDPPLTMLLANIVRYLAPPPGRRPDTPLVSLADGTPQVGQELVMTTDLKDNNYEPIRSADLVVTVTPPDGRSYRQYPRDLPEEPGYYVSRILIEQPGPYKVTAKHGKFESQREFLAGAAAGEFVDLSVDRPGMQRLVKAAGGELVEGGVASWIDSTAIQPARRLVERDLEVWNSPLVLLAFLLLVSVDCWIRKRQGMV